MLTQSDPLIETRLFSPEMFEVVVWAAAVTSGAVWVVLLFMVRRARQARPADAPNSTGKPLRCPSPDYS